MARELDVDVVRRQALRVCVCVWGGGPGRWVDVGGGKAQDSICMMKGCVRGYICCTVGECKAPCGGGGWRLARKGIG